MLYYWKCRYTNQYFCPWYFFLLLILQLYYRRYSQKTINKNVSCIINIGLWPILTLKSVIAQCVCVWLWVHLCIICSIHMTLRQTTKACDNARLVSNLRHSGSAKPIGILYMVLSFTSEPDMSKPQQTGQNVWSLKCDDQAAWCLSWWSGNEFPEQTQKLFHTLTGVLHWTNNTPLSCRFINTYTCCYWLNSLQSPLYIGFRKYSDPLSFCNPYGLWLNLKLVLRGYFSPAISAQ